MKYFLLIKNADGDVRMVPVSGVIDITVEPGEDIIVMDENGNPVDVSLRPIGEDLVVDFKDGNKAILKGFYDTEEGTDAITISLNPVEPADPDYEFNSQTGNLPSARGFTLMRFSNTEYTEFVDQLDDLNIGHFLGSLSGGNLGGSASDPAPVPNSGPDAVDDISSGVQGVPLVIDVLENDTDPDPSDALVISGVDQPGLGRASINSSNQIIFDPGTDFDYLDAGESTTVTFDYTISDGNGGTDTASVTVTVNGADDATDTAPDIAVTNEDTPVVIDVLANDSDIDASDNPLSVVSVTQPGSGSVMNNGGNLTFDPGSDFESLAVGESATVTFTYTTDTGITENVTVTVNGSNDGPDAIDDVATTDQDTSITIDAVDNDTDPDPSDALLITGVNQPTKGSVSIDSSNQIAFDPGSDFDDLDAGESATVTFDYTISDGNGGTDTASVTVTVNGADDATDTAPDTGATDEDTSFNLDVLANDSDIDTSDNPLAIASVTQPALGAVTNNGSDISFDPAGDFEDLAVGESTTVTFTYTTDTGTTENVTVTVNGVNDGPDAIDDATTTNQGSPVTVDVLDNDTDPDTSDALIVTGVTQPSQGSATYNAGDLTFDPGADFDYLDAGESATATFDYTISDGNGGTDTATVTVTVNGADDATDTAPDTAVTNENTPVVIEVLANDSDIDASDNPLSVVSVTQPGSGSVTNNGGNLTFDPGTDFESLAVGESATVTFTYTTDTGITENVTVTVNGSNDGPDAIDDVATTDQDTSITIDAVDNDTDPDTSDALLITGVNQPAKGSVSIDSSNQIAFDPGSDFDDLDAGESATATFDYTISDGNGGTDTATVTVTVNGADDATDTAPDTAVTNEDTPVVVDVLANDSDIDTSDNPLGVASVTQPALGSVTNNGGNLTFDPGTDFEGLAAGESSTVTFTYTTDTGTTENVTVTVNGVNDGPDAIDDATTTNQGSPVTVDVLGNDTDPDTSDALIVTGVTQPAQGSATYNAGDLTFDPGSDFDYLDAGESATATFDYTISDGNGGTDTASVTVTVNGADDATDTAPDMGVTDEDTAFNLDVLANDSDVDTSDNPLTIASVTQPTLGMVTNNGGDISFDPAGDFESLAVGESATVTFTYTTDTGVTENVTVTVSGVNDNPEAVNDTKVADQDSVVSIDLLGNGDSTGPDFDLDGDSLSVVEIEGSGVASNSVVVLASGAEVTVRADGTADYDSNDQFDSLSAGESALDTFTYTISDGNGGTDTATVTVTINGVDDTTVTNPDADVTTESSSVTIDVLANDSDVDTVDNPLSVVSVTQPGSGSVTNNGGNVTFDPGSDFESLAVGESATVNFTYTTNTGVTESVSVTINGENDGPEAVDDSGSTNQGGQVTIDALDNDSDPDISDALILAGVDQPARGSVTIDASNQIVFDAGSDFDDLDVGESATTTFDYTISDGNGGTDTATVTVTVNGAEDATDTDPDSATTDEETAIIVDVLANDSDVDTTDNPLTVASVTQPGKGSVINNGSNVTFDPGTDFRELEAGESETVMFTYTTGTGVVENATVTVNGVTNLIPEDDFESTDEDTAVSISPLDNDTIAPWITAGVTEIDSQSIAVGNTVTVGSGASVTLQAGNTISYDPLGSFDHLQVGETATDTFTYEVSGGIGLSATATETITISGVNDGPTIDTIDITTIDGDPVQLDLSKLASTDPDHLDPADLAYNVDDVTGGYFALTSNTGSAITNFTQQQVNDGDVTFVPTSDEPSGISGGHIDIDTYDSSGSSTGHEHAYDDNTNLTVWNYFGLAEESLVESVQEILVENSSISGETKFKILIGNADLSPGISLTVNENYDPDNASTFVAGTEYDDSDLSSLTVYSLDGVAGSTQLTSLVLSADRSIIADAGIIPTETGSVQSNDPGKDGEYRNGAFTIQIVAVNDDGTDAFTTDTDISNGGVQGIATAGNGLLWESTLFWHWDNGSYDSGSPFIAGDPSSIYDELETGGSADGATFQLTISDPPGLSDTDSGALGWDSAPPEPNPDFYTVTQGGTVTTDPLDNDSDPTGDDLSITHADGILLPYGYPVTIANGATVTLQFDGSIDYTPSRIDVGAGQTGTETFTYTVRDSKDATATETVTITINGLDDPTITNPDSATTAENTPVNIDVLDNDSDPDISDNPLTIASLTQPGLGSVANNGGDVTFDPGTDFDYLAIGETTTVTFTYTTDTGVSDTVTVTVTGENDAPDVQDDIVVSTTDIDPVTIDVVANDSDVDGTVDASTVDLDTTTAGVQQTLVVANEGTWVTDGTGKVTFTPDAALAGQPTSIDYAVTDNDGGVGIGTIDLKYSAADVWFGNDESGSVSDADFSQSRNLISGAADQMTFATGNIAFNAAVFTWADSGDQSSELTLSSDKTQFVNDSSGYTRNFTGGTDIGAGVVFGTQLINASVAAKQLANDVRADIPQVMVILTDASDSQILDDSSLLNDAQTAKDAGIIIVFVAIQEAQDNPTAVARLEQAASLDQNNNALVITADSYADIDSAEIADLLNAIREAAAAGLLPPVVIDLDGDGVEFDDIENGIKFDVDGDGELEQVAWASEDDAVLVYDQNDNDQVDSVDEISFARYSDQIGATDLEGLRHFDSNEDLVLDANDAEFDSFKLWQDRDGDGTVDEGEMMTLSEAGIESIELTSDENSYYTAGGDVLVHGEGTVNFEDGSTGTLADAEFQYQELADSGDIEVVTESGDILNVNDPGDTVEAVGSDLLEGDGGQATVEGDGSGVEGGTPTTTSGEEEAAAAMA